MQAFILDRFVTKAFEFFFEMQHATLEISDHQVIGRVMRQRLSNFFF